MRHRVWALVGATACLLLATRAHAQCSKDTECKGDRVCEDGTCVSPPPATAAAPAAAAAPPAEPPPAAAPAPATPAAVPVVAPYREAPGEEGRPYFRRRSPGLMTTGIVMTASALPLGLVGAYMSDESYKDCLRDAVPVSAGQTGQYEYENDCENSRETRNVVIGVLAIAMIGVGIPLIVYGAKRIPNTEQVTLTPWVSPTAAGATLRWSTF